MHFGAIQELTFSVTEPNEDAKAKISVALDKLKTSRSWLVSEPGILDIGDEKSVEPGFRKLGGVLTLAAAQKDVPRDVDVHAFRDVEALILQLQELSRLESLSFEIELGGEFIGMIEDGRLDRSLREGLISEWARALGVASSLL